MGPKLLTLTKQRRGVRQAIQTFNSILWATADHNTYLFGIEIIQITEDWQHEKANIRKENNKRMAGCSNIIIVFAKEVGFV